MKCLLDLHTHTIASGHAYSTLQENVIAAKKNNLKVLGISDHAPAMPGSQHIYYFHNMKVIPKEIECVRVLKGVETNIMDLQGSIDMSYENLDNLDYAIASMHPPCIPYGTERENTLTLTRVMQNPYVKIIGHPDDNRYPLNYTEVVKAAKENGVLLEINNSSLNPFSFREKAKENIMEILDLSVKLNHPILLGSDAHISYDIGNFQHCYRLLNEIDFPEELVINYSIEKTFEFLEIEK